MTWLRAGGWRVDTLSKRLFFLLWATLVLSHVLGFWLAHPAHPAHAPRGDAGLLAPAWLVPSLPPVPGLQHEQPGFNGPHGPPPPPLSHGPKGAPGPHGPPLLWLDYLARLLVMGLAAWLGARWLTAPLRRLTQASRKLGQSLGQGDGDLPLLDEAAGPQEVRQTAQVFNDMARGLHAQFEQRSLMMAAVSHDLRTPLTRLRMRLESLRPDPVAERCVRDVQDINALIDSVLDVMNEERRQEARQPVDILAMVQAMADDLQEAGQRVSVAGEPVTLAVQPVAFRRMLSNLVGNALRYGHAAAITVALPPGMHALFITVDDEGPGIPADQLEAVFKPFVRLDASRSRDTGGVGLGLYIARELAHRHGADIELHNRPEGGLRALVRVPLP